MYKTNTHMHVNFIINSELTTVFCALRLRETEIEFDDLSRRIGFCFYITKAVCTRSSDSDVTTDVTLIVTHLTTFPYRRGQIKCHKLVSR